MPKSELTEIAVEVRHETPAVYLIFDGKLEVWVPKSLVDLHREKVGAICVMPIWLAKREGLI